MTQIRYTVPIFPHRPLFRCWAIACCFVLSAVQSAVVLQSQIPSNVATTRLVPSRSLNTYHFQTRIYTVDDGLPTNLTKDVVADKHGFVWIATDAGLVRFDGYHFLTISEGLPSRFVKKLLLLHNGRLIAATDGGIVEVENSDGVPRIHVLLHTSIQPSDSTILYPKSLFEDAVGTLWIAEPNSIVRVFKSQLLKQSTGNITKPRFRCYQFPAEYASNSVVRSFMFAQDVAGTLLVSGSAGYCYWYNPALDTFSLLMLKHPVGLIHHLCAMRSKQGEVLAAMQKGILKIRFQATKFESAAKFSKKLHDQLLPFTFENRLISKLQETSALMQSRRSGVVYCGAWYNGIHLIAPQNLAEQREVSPLQRMNTLWEAQNGAIGASNVAWYKTRIAN